MAYSATIFIVLLAAGFEMAGVTSIGWAPPHYSIDLDIPPEHRWDKVATIYAHLAASIRLAFEYLTMSFASIHLSSYILMYVYTIPYSDMVLY